MVTLDANYWNARWESGQTGWDIGQASPPLTEYAASVPPSERAAMRVLIPGCGNAYEARELLRMGYGELTLLDIAPEALASARARFEAQGETFAERIRWVCADFFEHEDAYDLILEQTFFCALDPALRPRYARQMHALLRPGGRLAGVLFDRAFEGGPPFGGSIAEYRALFEPLFEIETLIPCPNSIAPRQGAEAFFVVRK